MNERLERLPSRLALHESGHVIAAFALGMANDDHVVSIAGASGGFFGPRGTKPLTTDAVRSASSGVLLSGRAGAYLPSLDFLNRSGCALYAGMAAEAFQRTAPDDEALRHGEIDRLHHDGDRRFYGLEGAEFDRAAWLRACDLVDLHFGEVLACARELDLRREITVGEARAIAHGAPKVFTRRVRR